MSGRRRSALIFLALLRDVAAEGVALKPAVADSAYLDQFRLEADGAFGNRADQAHVVVARYGKPDLDDSTAYDQPRPPIVDPLARLPKRRYPRAVRRKWRHGRSAALHLEGNRLRRYRSKPAATLRGGRSAAQSGKANNRAAEKTMIPRRGTGGCGDDMRPSRGACGRSSGRGTSLIAIRINLILRRPLRGGLEGCTMLIQL
jgi:hypothetical protein